MENLVRIKDSNGNRKITNDSVIQIDHYHEEDDIDYNKEAQKLISFMEKRCSHKLFRAVKKDFYLDEMPYSDFINEIIRKG